MAETTVLKAKTGKIEDEKALQRFTQIAEYILKNKGEGKVLYNSGVKNNFQWRPICYASQNFRAYYALEMFGVRSELVCNAFKTAVEKGIVSMDVFRDITKVASVGCGPGAEMWGFKIFCEEMMPFSSNCSNITRQSPRFVGFDSELGWMPFVEALDFEFVNKEITLESLRGMLPTDVIILSYFAKFARVNLNNERNTEFWEELEKKGNFIIVLDAPDETLHFLLKSRGYNVFTLTDKHGQDCQVHCLQQADYAVLRRSQHTKITRK